MLSQQIIQQLELSASQENAKAMSAYMKNHFDFFGIKSQARKDAVKSLIKSHKSLPLSELKSEIKTLWLYPKREAQYVAQELYSTRIKEDNVDAIDFLHWMITTRSWWDSVDFLASHLVGKLALLYPTIKTSHLTHWTTDTNLWLRRTSLIFQLKYKNDVDEKFLLNAIEANLADNDFFIRKAIGWSLRQYSKFNPQFVRRVVENYPLSHLSQKEASKYL